MVSLGPRGRAALALAAVAGAIAVGGCGGSSGSKAAGADTLGEALAYAPPGTQEIFVTDWGAIKAEHGASSLTSASPASRQTAFFAAVSRTADVAPLMSEASSSSFAKRWGWDSADLAWEAMLEPASSSHGGSAPLIVQGFPSAFDLGRVESSLKRCGARAHSEAGATVYSNPGVLTSKCAGPFGLVSPELANVAVVAHRSVLLLSGDPSTLRKALAAGGGLAHDPSVAALSDHLAGDASVYLAPASSFCSQLTAPVLAGRLSTPAAVKEVLARNPKGAPYLGFAFGYQLGGRSATARIVMHYASAAAARRALPQRERALRVGFSVAANEPYSQLIHLDSASADGSDVVLEVSAPAGHPLRLNTMAVQRDFAFARC